MHMMRFTRLRDMAVLDTIRAAAAGAYTWPGARWRRASASCARSILPLRHGAGDDKISPGACRLQSVKMS